MNDRDRRKPFTPGPGVPVMGPVSEEDLTPVNRIELAALRDDIRLVAETQTSDRKQLNGRMAEVDREQKKTARELADVRVEVVKIGERAIATDDKVGELLEMAKEDRAERTQERLLDRRVRAESVIEDKKLARADKEITKVRMDGRLKIILAIFGIVSAAAGILGKYLLHKAGVL